jgi:hypothetical protein
VTETDAKRKENLSEELKDMGIYLDFLEDVKSLPYEFCSTVEIQSKAFDFMTATLGLIMLQVKHFTTGIIAGNGGYCWQRGSLLAMQVIACIARNGGYCWRRELY